MKSRTVVLLLIFVLLTILAGYALSVRGRFSASSARMIRERIPVFKPEEITSIRISWRTREVNLLWKDGRWEIDERDGKIASASRISKLLESLSTLNPVKKLDDCGEEILKRLHLYTDDPKVTPGIMVCLRDSEGRERFRILLGKGHFVKAEPGMPPSETAEGRYVKIGREVFLIPKVFEYCHPVPEAWVEPLRLFQLNKALLIMVGEIAKDGRDRVLWAVTRANTAHPFTMQAPVKGGKVDNGQLSLLADALSKPFGLDFSLKPPAKVAFTGNLVFKCADGFQYILEVGREGRETYGLLSVTYDPAAVVEMPGESASELAVRKQALRQRYEFEKTYFHQNLFLISDKIPAMIAVIPEKK